MHTKKLNKYKRAYQKFSRNILEMEIYKTHFQSETDIYLSDMPSSMRNTCNQILLNERKFI